MKLAVGQPVWYAISSEYGAKGREQKARAVIRAFPDNAIATYCFIDILDTWLAGRTIYAFQDELRPREVAPEEITAPRRKRGRPRKAKMS